MVREADPISFAGNAHREVFGPEVPNISTRLPLNANGLARDAVATNRKRLG